MAHHQRDLYAHLFFDKRFQRNTHLLFAFAFIRTTSKHCVANTLIQLKTFSRICNFGLKWHNRHNKQLKKYQANAQAKGDYQWPTQTDTHTHNRFIKWCINNENNNCQAQPKWKGNTDNKQWPPRIEWPITCWLVPCCYKSPQYLFQKWHNHKVDFRVNEMCAIQTVVFVRTGDPPSGVLLHVSLSLCVGPSSPFSSTKQWHFILAKINSTLFFSNTTIGRRSLRLFLTKAKYKKNRTFFVEQNKHFWPRTEELCSKMVYFCTC